MTTFVDARGHRCPVPTLRLRKAMAEAGPQRQVTLLADDPMARIDAPHLVQALGGRVIAVRDASLADGLAWLEITVETPAASEA